MNLAGQWGLVALGGALGAMARHGVNLWMALASRSNFPYATLSVNAAGSLVAGMFFVLYTQAYPDNAGLRLFGAVGFLGAFTTFSAFSVDTMLLLGAGNWRDACVNIVLNLTVCLVLCGFGIAVARATFI